MNRGMGILLVSALLVTGCGRVRDSVINPVNWFGRSQSTANVPTDTEVNPLIPARRASIFRQEQDDSYRGTDVAEVTGLFVERRPGGAVIRAEGTALYQGPFDVRLVKLDEESDESTLTYALRALQPRGAQGPAQTRRVIAADWLTDNELLGIRTIRVKAQGNTRTARR